MKNQNQLHSALSSATGRQNTALLLLAAAIGLCFNLYWSGIQSLLSAWQRPEYSHGYIIPLIALFIALKRYQPSYPPRSKWLGLTIVVISILVGMFGNAAGIADIVTYGLLLSIAGFAIVLLGLGSAAHLWPAWVYLGFMLPLPNFVYWPLSIKLQFLSSQIGVQFIKWFGIPVFLEGNIIDLGNYQLQVAEACSGLRYLFPLLSFGFLFATLYRGPGWQKLIILLSTIPITIFMNSLRIGIIGFLVDRYGIAQAEGFLHLFEGWVIFMVCILMLYFLAVALRLLTQRSKPLSEAIDVSFQGIGSKARQMAEVEYSNPLLAGVIILAAAIPISATLFSHVSIHPQRLSLDQFPVDMEGWKGKREYLDFNIERVLAADDYLQADFADPTQATGSVNLLISYYDSQTEGSGIHSPEVCIPAGGWEVSKWEQVNIPLAALNGATLSVNRAIIQKEKDRQLVYYWFEQRGRRFTNDYVAKGFTVWDSVTRGRSDGALVRVITPLGNDASTQAAEERLKRFLEIAMDKLPSFVPP